MPTPFDILADNIVDPRCDECGASVRPRDPLLGPHLCASCTAAMIVETDARFRDYQSQEKRRRIHVVKLPPELR